MRPLNPLETPMDDNDLNRNKTGRLERWRKYSEISELGPIARRYFVMNAFDGALTMLGVVIGASMAHMDNPAVIIAAGISGSFAMGISGFSGAYMAESAERNKELKGIEKAMCKTMHEDSMHKEAAKFATKVTSLVDAISPALAALLVVSPYFLVNIGILTMSSAFYASLAITFMVLALLGVYLAKVTEENLLWHAIKMLGVGVVTVILCVFVSWALGTGGVV
jgi:predicted membrane protein (TIGR00267 family)